MTYISSCIRLKKKHTGAQSTPVTGFGFSGGNAVPNPNSWAKWLQNQPAPVAKPGSRLYTLSEYYTNGTKEYGLALDLTQRWGYALNIGYGNGTMAAIDDAKTGNPVTDLGKLCKLAIDNPAAYPVAGYVNQGYPPIAICPEGYLRKANGDPVLNGNAQPIWSPEATPAAMAIAANYKTGQLGVIVAAGMRVGTLYDGGELGLQTATDPQNNFALDPRVVTAKGSDGWVAYISRKKGEQQRYLYERVKTLVPNRRFYVFYPNTAGAYQNIPGQDLYTFDYDQMANIADLPSGSVYFKDYFTLYSSLGNPDIRDRAYYDQLTHQMAAVSEQIVTYNKPFNYSFVSAGWSHNTPCFPADPYYFYSLKSYKGFLKCMYASGSLGLVAGYFSRDCDLAYYEYPPYDPDPAKVPHWLRQQTALGEVHARFSWLDNYILDADLLPGLLTSKVKPSLPAYEFQAYTKPDIYYVIKPGVRVFVRKLKTANKWLLVLWAYEKGDLTDGDPVSVYVRDIPGVEALEYLARPEGSVYTIDKTGGNTVVTWEDPS